MYFTLLILHSFFRWLVLASLLFAIFRAYRGYTARLAFTPADNLIQHCTATIAHIQLILGFTLYFVNPFVQTFRQQGLKSGGQILFFGVIHVSVMLGAIVLITLGSAMAKRQAVDSAKFRTMLIWYSMSLLVIFLAIPWPFFPLANRPYFRLL